MRNRTVWLIGLALLVVVFAGCGANQSQSARPSAQPPEDVLLFDAGEPSPEVWADTGKTPGIALKTNGHFYQRAMSLGGTIVYSFTTHVGVVYQVEAVGTRQGDDIDLALSRDPDPVASGWKYSMRPPPRAEGFVFRSSQDGTMYLAAHGHYSGMHDNTVEYAIHVRKCQFGTFTQ